MSGFTKEHVEMCEASARRYDWYDKWEGGTVKCGIVVGDAHKREAKMWRDLAALIKRFVDE